MCIRDSISILLYPIVSLSLPLHSFSNETRPSVHQRRFLAVTICYNSCINVGKTYPSKFHSLRYCNSDFSCTSNISKYVTPYIFQQVSFLLVFVTKQQIALKWQRAKLVTSAITLRYHQSVNSEKRLYNILAYFIYTNYRTKVFWMNIHSCCSQVT